MSVDIKEFNRWSELSEEEQLDEVMTIIKSMPATDQLKLVMYLTKKAPQVCDTRFFLEFAKMHHDLRL